MTDFSQSPPHAPLTPSDRDLTTLNTLGLSARAQACVTLSHVDQLPTLTDLALQYPGLLVLGGGSNMVLPAWIQSLVVRVALTGVRLIEERSDAWIIEAGAGENWHDFVTTCVDRGWSGLENLALIPGTVGAAPVQNIGAYGVELADRFSGLSAWHVGQRRLVQMTSAECRFAYRDSVFKHAAPGEWIIVSVRFALPKPWRPVLDYPDLRRYFGDLAAPTARDIYQAVCEIRRAKLPDPAVVGNAGSFFKNPIVSASVRDTLLQQYPGLVSYPQPDGRYKLAAGWLIDQCGWKGKQLGAAGVHDRQALVLVNKGAATADDIMTLAAAIQRDVAARYQVHLEPEPVVWRDHSAA
ncbi:UDP-N-acetylmuramate dehydrogenase [Bordetella sp. 15P40C-2]|uniref:UDP-N-acetylmuramate dehydrogenase n=1 Tax=Bordetella sp. 15P40C-2 TaxID=2572246 RepID=UPI001329906D|nr:UDP-N-acetylmuramate dehydrogenase [Bordetella sp. 15P40C-2]MVW73544.1 UDP-N-acetylmuramate dehydrogenase [Bordetella sp. 15P40C-2]